MARIASRQETSERRNRVLIAAANDLENELGRSVLWREDVERVFVSSLDRVHEAVRDHQPHVLVLDAADADVVTQIIRGCRQDRATRGTGIVALSRGDGDDHDTLRAAGANLVLSMPVDPALWDGPIAALLHVPPRRDLRVPVMLEAWSTTRPGEALVEGVALNISVRGILLEAARPLNVGTKFDLSFSLPDGPGEFRAVGQVVRQADGDARLVYGIQFLVLQGEARDRIDRFVAASAPSLLGGAHRKVLTFRQTVERREWEAELRASEARNAAILASVLEAIVISSHEARVVEFNPSAEAAFGWSRAEAVGRRLDEILPGFTETGFRQKAFSAGEGSSLGRRVETVGRRFDGSEFPAELAVTRVDLEGAPLFALCLRDITERKRAENTHARATAQFHALFERAADAMAVTDDDGRYVEVNAAACTLYGLERRDLLGRWLGDLASPGFDFQTLLAEPRGSVGKDLRVRRPDGSARDVELAATPDFLPGSHLVVLRDQTERRALEAQFRQAQKMEAVGRLAGGVAHDFNNLLGVIGGYADLLLRKLVPDSPERRKAEHIRDASNRAAGLTQKLLAFSRKQLLQPRVLDLNAVVTGVATMLTRVIREDIELHMDLDERLGSLRADPGQIEQVLMNLAINARDAMPDGGKIVIETRNVDLPETSASDSLGARPGPYVRLRFSDTGSGMDAETRRHIFEPFFTTKEPGQGTGLGLSTVFGVVTQSDGHITVDSKVGDGTTFTIYLPRSEDDLDAPGSNGESKPSVSGHETVLVVEDQPMLRSLTRELLTEAGYRVLDAENGDAALRLAGDHPGPIHLLVTDVVMPGMTGLELARRLVATRPKMRVVYCSGYTEDEVVRSGRVGPGSAFLPKPFAPAELERLVRHVLDAPPI